MIAALRLTLLFLAVMTAVAGHTAGRRICRDRRWAWALLPVSGSSARWMSLRSRRGELEAALAVGLSPRHAALLVCREPAADSLIPVPDQTRPVGLVTLPGAFVGMLLGGASPIQAGAVQLLVLVGLLAVQALAVLITVELVAVGCFPLIAV
ncbi:MAG: ABC transporter permease [Pseudonocardiaceae bacterium]